MTKYFLAGGILAVLFSACTSPRYIYSAAPANVPYFQAKNDSKFSALYSGGSCRATSSDLSPYNRGFDLQGAYAVSDHWAVMASYFNRFERDIYNEFNKNYFDSSLVKYKRKLTELGGGYFTALGNNRIIYFAAYAGLGTGRFSFTDRGIDKSGLDYDRFHSVRVNKYFIQPTFYFSPSQNFRASFVGRFSFVHYGEGKTNYTAEEREYFFLDRIPKKTFSFFEPGFNLQFGIPRVDWIKVEASMTFSSKPYRHNLNLEARGMGASIGMCFDFFKLAKK